MSEWPEPRQISTDPPTTASVTVDRFSAWSTLFRRGRRFFGHRLFFGFFPPRPKNIKSQKLIDRILAGVDEQCGPFGIELQHLTARVLAGITVCIFLAFL